LALADDASAQDGQASARLMQTLDRIVQRHGKGAVQLASASLNHAAAPIWQMKQMRRTPGYTTDWDDLATARC
jgi:DNA polymerase V